MEGESGLTEEAALRIDQNGHKEESSEGSRDLFPRRMVLARSRAA